VKKKKQHRAERDVRVNLTRSDPTPCPNTQYVSNTENPLGVFIYLFFFLSEKRPTTASPRRSEIRRGI